MAGGRQLTVTLVANTKSFSKGMTDAFRSAEGFKGKMSSLGSSLSMMAGPAFLAAGAAAGAFAAKLAVDGVNAAIEEEKQLAILKQTLDNVGQGFAMDEVNTFIDNLRFATGVTDDELRPAFEKLIGVTKDASSAQKLLQASVDASVGSGKDLSSVSMAVAKAVAGSSTALKKLIPELDATTIKGGGAEKVIAALSSRFGGSASAAAQTFAGQLQRLQDGFAELTESFGKGFIDSLDQSKKSMDGMAQTMRDLQPLAESTGQQIGSMASALAGLTKVLEMGQSAWESVPSWIKAIITPLTAMINPIGTAIQYFEWFNLAAGNDGATKTSRQLADEFIRSGKSAAIMSEMMESSALPTTHELGDAAASSSDSILLLRESIRLATRSLSPLTAAFDEANAAMDRRQSMQDYRDALKAFITDPSAETRDAAVSAAIDMANSFDKPKQAIKFTGDAMADIIDAAKDAGVRIPPEVAAIQAAFEVANDPITRTKQLLEDIPRNIPVTITVTTTETTAGGRPIATGGPVYATGGPVRAALGTHASDNVPAMLSRGEYVLNADAVKRLGVGTLNRLNNGGAMGGDGGSIAVYVNSAPGERAEESVPRALRRLAFVAGLNG